MSGEEYIFRLVNFLVSSARGCIDEPPLYASFRLLDALERIIDLHLYVPCLKEDNFLKELKSVVEENKFLVLTDPEKFKVFLDELLRKLAREAGSRARKA